MVEFDDSTTQRSPQDMEELPPSVNVYHYKDIDEFYKVISLELDRLDLRAEQNKRAWASGSCEGRKDYVTTLPQTEGTQSDHVIFIIEPLDFARDFLNEADHHPWHVKRIGYNPATNILIAKMAEATHEEAAIAFDDMVKTALEPMGLKKAIQSWGTKKLIAADGTTKQADGGWSPLRPPRGAPKRPSVVLEVGSSETSAKLRRDAHYWVDPARGQADMAIGVKVYAKKPQITIEQWEWNTQRSRPVQTARLTITKSKGKVYFDPDQPTPQILIPFDLLFRRPAENNRERDLVLSTQELVEFAIMVWQVQFEDEEQ
jgi:hypothetical protein